MSETDFENELDTQEVPFEQESKDTAISDAFTEAREAGKDEDAIKLAMIQAGATFKNVAKLYSDLMVDAGLLASKEDKESAIKQVLAEGVVLATKEAFDSAVASLVSLIKGATEKSAASIVRAFAKKNEIECYVAPKSEGTGTVRNPFTTNFYEGLVANPHMTEDELKAIIAALPAENQVNPLRWMHQHNAIRKMVNKIAAKYSI